MPYEEIEINRNSSGLYQVKDKLIFVSGINRFDPESFRS